MARKLDPIDEMICSAVQYHLVSRRNNPPALKPAPPGVVEVEGSAVGPRKTRVRVKTENQGTIYYTISVTRSI